VGLFIPALPRLLFGPTLMELDDPFDLPDDPNFISGIFNYCDRWCERCPLTARCRLYAMEKASDDDPAANDIRNAAFWDKLKGIFETTRKMVEKMAEEMGIDLDAAIKEDAGKERRKRRVSARKQDPAAEAEKYAMRVEAWFKEHKPLFREKGKELESVARMEL